MTSLSLLKLAHTTRHFDFVNDHVRISFLRLLMFATAPICSRTRVFQAFREFLTTDFPATSTDPKELKKLVSILRRTYSTQKWWFFPRVTYKYLLMVEILYICALAEQPRELAAFTDLCTLLHIKENEQSLLASSQMTSLQGYEKTLLPLLEFINQEKTYNTLPRRNVSVFSTMSAGKSTFVNALLGHDYLPSRNAACTAKVASIADNDRLEYVVGYAVKQGEPVYKTNIDSAMLKIWNCDPEVTAIFLEGDLDSISSNQMVTVIHDTPGLNYSRNTGHKEITLRHLWEVKPDIVLCLLDATQLQNTNFQEALDDLKDCVNKTSVVFIVNKADKFDADKENLSTAIEKVAEDLHTQGFQDPIVIPVSAKAARLFKMESKGDRQFTEDEKDDLRSFTHYFSRDCNNFSTMAFGIDTTAVSDTGADPLYFTGLPLVEYILNSKIANIRRAKNAS